MLKGKLTEYSRATTLRVRTISGSNTIQDKTYDLKRYLSEEYPEVESNDQLARIPLQEYKKRVDAFARFVENQEKLTGIDPEKAYFWKTRQTIRIHEKAPDNQHFTIVQLTTDFEFASDVKIDLAYTSDQKEILILPTVYVKKGERLDFELFDVDKDPRIPKNLSGIYDSTIEPEGDHLYNYSFHRTMNDYWQWM